MPSYRTNKQNLEIQKSQGTNASINKEKSHRDCDRDTVPCFYTDSFFQMEGG